MTTNALLQLTIYVVVLLALVKPLGTFMARVYENKPCGLDKILGPLERLIYRLCGVNPTSEMTWQHYTYAVLAVNFIGLLIVYGLLRLQYYLPLNPEGLAGTAPHLAFNTAVSFATNTNWQSYGGEATLGYFAQMLGLAVQNFLSAASGMAVLVALVRGFARRQSATIGNFWFDITRSTLYILLPLSVVLALVLVSQGVVQTFNPYAKVALLQPTSMQEPVLDDDGSPVLDGQGQPTTKTTPVIEQTIAGGPAASQIAIKQLGTNGGGFFNVNSSHPLENPTPISNFFQLLSILVISAALCYTFGKMINDTRQGWAVLAAMFVVFLPLLALCYASEQSGTPALAAAGADQLAGPQQAGGNMEGKEVRHGIALSALWATATTAASNGSVNSMHDSYTPLGGLVPMWLMQLGEVVFGGVGSGLYGMLAFAIIAVFIGGLMVGRTPEYLGKKIEAFEMKMAAIIILVPPLAVLVGTAVAVSFPDLAKPSIPNSGAHGFSEVLYAFSSAGNNNGSAFAGLNANVPFFDTLLGLCMLAGRFLLMVPILAIAGSLAAKKYTPVSSGTLPTHGPLFVALLVGAVLLVGALTFVPALALGPIVEHLQMLE
ncbi:MAG: potassium-transporting ATPase subunit KdpA [Pirellulales bacterium]